MSHLERAVEVAEIAHEGQWDKTGRPYIEHCRRIAGQVETLDEKIVAYLHDVLEKGVGWTPERLAECGFSSAVLSAVEAMTKRQAEDEAAFVRRAASNPLGRAVKRADLEDNLRQARQVGASTEKYEQGIRLLSEGFR